VDCGLKNNPKMKVLIIEDEKPAAEKLERHLKKYDPTIEVADKISSVEKAVNWLGDDQNYVDLIFMDVQLTDGLSFDIFKKALVQKPVIFTTAFNEYAIEAFKGNGIDYLLKPITYEALAGSLQKLDNLRRSLGASAPAPLSNLEQALHLLQKKNYKNRFMVRTGEHIHSIPAADIILFYAEDRNVFLQADNRKKYIIDYKMEELEDILDPALFFRVNRTFIVSINAIRDVIVYSNSRLLIRLQFDFDKEIVVSRERVQEFKDWFNGLG
jgi:two-component system, LytTR family, response regulator